MNKIKIEIILLCHNRPKLVIEAIQSILNQNNKNFNLIISDNSNNLDTKKIIEEKYPALTYISHYPGIELIDHFNWVLQNIKGEYFVMFHDDDLLLNNYVDVIIKNLTLNNSFVAIGTNGYKSIENKETLFELKKENNIINNSNTLLHYYLSPELGGVPAFSSYCYNKKLLNSSIELNCGYYFDTIFLADIASYGALLWLNKPLTVQRDSYDRLSHIAKVNDYKLFINNIKKKYNQLNSFYILEYRIVNLISQIKKIKTKKLFSSKKKSKIILNNLYKLFFNNKNFRVRIYKFIKVRLL